MSVSAEPDVEKSEICQQLDLQLQIMFSLPNYICSKPQHESDTLATFEANICSLNVDISLILGTYKNQWPEKRTFQINTL